ncbi:hypothetical protein [Undibacterium sp. Ji42W]|uniref:hypothetical protein n=1 Tax=Undibacterium sp. Ji42W TaxID=3413039 RepID=UPI003BF5B13C
MRATPLPASAAKENSMAFFVRKVPPSISHSRYMEINLKNQVQSHFKSTLLTKKGTIKDHMWE